jgi:rfaE bifunctional protein nucleotidyltransferase chain/domain
MKIKKKIIGLIHGVFDIIHIGHINYFKEAKSKVDHLIVSITSDKFVNKGPGKPIFNLQRRIEVLRSIKYIDEIVVSDHATAVHNLKIIKPDYFIKGKDYKNLKNDLTKHILLEKKTVEKYGGKILFTNSELHSSSAIANNVFEYINDDIKKILKKIDKTEFGKNFFNLVQIKLQKKILIIGDPIIDILRFVELSGKANKSNVLSTKYLSEEINFGGILLVANFLNLFCKNVTLLFCGNIKNLSLIKKNINKGIKILHVKTSNEMIKKIRYVDSYTNNRLFQNNFNEKDKFTSSEEKKIIKKIDQIKKKFDEILLFDYGYSYSNKKLTEFINKNKKINVNCQSNSYNFGYNLANKYIVGKTISMDETEFRLIVKNREDKLERLIKDNSKLFNKFKNFIITQGKKGCYLRKSNKLIFVPSIINSSIDSTGSGDIFLAMYIIMKVAKNFSEYESLICSHIAAGIHANELGNRFNIKNTDIYKILSNILK